MFPQMLTVLCRWSIFLIHFCLRFVLSANCAYDLNENLIYYDRVAVFCEPAEPAVVLVQRVNSATTQGFPIHPVYGTEPLIPLYPVQNTQQSLFYGEVQVSTQDKEYANHIFYLFILFFPSCGRQ